MKKKFKVEYTSRFEKKLKVLDRMAQLRVLREVKILEDNSHLGKPLSEPLKGAYSLRTGDYRVLYTIQEEKVFLLTVGHRKKIYKP